MQKGHRDALPDPQWPPRRRRRAAFSKAGRIGVSGLLLYWGVAHAQTTPGQQEQRERAQRQAEQRQRLQEAPDVRLQTEVRTDYHSTTLPQETPSFRIDRFVIEGAHREQFGFLQRYLDRYRGRQIGQRGLQLLVHRASDLLLARGYVTSRLLVAEQNLSQGQLTLRLLAGTVDRIRMAPDSAPVNWRSALPLRPGDVLNLRAIEQGLEQFRRLSSQEVKIDIAPGAAPDTSDLVISARRGKPWHVTLNLDDSGADSTGKEQGGITLGLDQPLGLNDLLTVGVTHAVGRYRGEKGTRGTNVSYSMPWGNWTFGASSYNYAYHQQVNGSLRTFTLSGNSPTRSLSVERLLQRDSVGKTSLQFIVSGREAYSAIDGVAIDNQRRQTRAAELALIHRRYLGAAQIDLRLAYRHSVPWFGGQWTAASQGGPSFRYGLSLLDASVNLPFQWGASHWLWTSELHAQATGDRLYVEDYLTIGGRYTVRGFDGEMTLGGEHGAYWRNTLAYALGQSGVSLYGGVDVGHVGGPGTAGAPGQTLSGSVVGLRGGRWGLNWDLFAGWAWHSPAGFHTRRPAAGMQWIYSF